jgi:hypothetical protein
MSVIVDAKGRKFTLRTLNVLDQVRLLRAIGPEQANNDKYAGIVQTAAMVDDIDGVPAPTMRNERDIDRIIGLIGDDGFAALTIYMQKEIATALAEAEAAQDVALTPPLEAPPAS